MTVNNYLKLLIPARSVNEGFARAAVAAFASQLDPTLSDITEIKQRCRRLLQTLLCTPIRTRWARYAYEHE